MVRVETEALRRAREGDETDIATVGTVHADLPEGVTFVMSSLTLGVIFNHMIAAIDEGELTVCEAPV